MRMPDRIRVPAQRNEGAIHGGGRRHGKLHVLLTGCFLFATVAAATLATATIATATLAAATAQPGGAQAVAARHEAPPAAKAPPRPISPGSSMDPAAERHQIQLIEEQAIRYRRQGRLAEAADLFQQALQGIERDPLASAARRAAATHNLAETLMRLGQYESAAAKFERALALWSEAGEPSERAVDTLLQLGHLRRLQGRYDDASKMLRRATALCGDSCRNGRDAAVGPALWGDLYLAQGRLAAAEASYEQARQTASQGDDALQADIWSGLAIVYRRQARYGEAEYAARRSLAAARRGLGAEHVKVAVGLANLGLIQAFERKYSAARKSLNAALALMEPGAGRNSPDVAAILGNLAFVEQQTGHLDAADSLLRRALAIYSEARGTQHPAVASTLASLGVVALARGEPWAAEEFFRKALALTKEAVGEEDPQAAALMVHLGLALTATGRPEQSFGLFERALAIQKRTLGEEHPEVAATLASWAKGLRAAGHHTDAARLEKRARQMHAERTRNAFSGQTVDVETLLRKSTAQP
jgi:tetratricopeptide (TPR) repeat protein